MGTIDLVRSVTRALLQLKLRVATLKGRGAGKELRDAEKAASVLEDTILQAPVRAIGSQNASLAPLGTAQQLSTDAGALLSELAACMRQGKLGEARRAWEVIRPVLSFLLWLLPEHILTPLAPAKQAATLASHSVMPGESSGVHASSEGVASNVVYTRTVATVTLANSVMDLMVACASQETFRYMVHLTPGGDLSQASRAFEESVVWLALLHRLHTLAWELDGCMGSEAAATAGQAAATSRGSRGLSTLGMAAHLGSLFIKHSSAVNALMGVASPGFLLARAYIAGTIIQDPILEFERSFNPSEKLLSIPGAWLGHDVIAWRALHLCSYWLRSQLDNKASSKYICMNRTPMHAAWSAAISTAQALQKGAFEQALGVGPLMAVSLQALMHQGLCEPTSQVPQRAVVFVNAFQLALAPILQHCSHTSSMAGRAASWPTFLMTRGPESAAWKLTCENRVLVWDHQRHGDSHLLRLLAEAHTTPLDRQQQGSPSAPLASPDLVQDWRRAGDIAMQGLLLLSRTGVDTGGAHCLLRSCATAMVSLRPLDPSHFGRGPAAAGDRGWATAVLLFSDLYGTALRESPSGSTRGTGSAMADVMLCQALVWEVLVVLKAVVPSLAAGQQQAGPGSIASSSTSAASAAAASAAGTGTGAESGSGSGPGDADVLLLLLLASTSVTRAACTLFSDGLVPPELCADCPDAISGLVTDAVTCLHLTLVLMHHLSTGGDWWMAARTRHPLVLIMALLTFLDASSIIDFAVCSGAPSPGEDHLPAVPLMVLSGQSSYCMSCGRAHRGPPSVPAASVPGHQSSAAPLSFIFGGPLSQQGQDQQGMTAGATAASAMRTLPPEPSQGRRTAPSARGERVRILRQLRYDTRQQAWVEVGRKSRGHGAGGGPMAQQMLAGSSMDGEEARGGAVQVAGDVAGMQHDQASHQPSSFQASGAALAAHMSPTVSAGLTPKQDAAPGCSSSATASGPADVSQVPEPCCDQGDTGTGQHAMSAQHSSSSAAVTHHSLQTPPPRPNMIDISLTLTRQLWSLVLDPAIVGDTPGPASWLPPSKEILGHSWAGLLTGMMKLLLAMQLGTHSTGDWTEGATARERGVRSRRAASSVSGPVASRGKLGSSALVWVRLIPRTAWQDLAQDTVHSPSYTALAAKAPQAAVSFELQWMLSHLLCAMMPLQAFCLVALNGPKNLVTMQQRQRIAALLGAAPLPAGMTGPFQEGGQDLLSACARDMFSTVGEDVATVRDLGQDLALACGLPQVAAWVKEGSGGSGGGSSCGTNSERAGSSSNSSGMAPGTPPLAGSSLPPRRRRKAGSKGCIAGTGALPAVEAASTPQQHLGYLGWLQKEVLSVLDEIQRDAGSRK